MVCAMILWPPMSKKESSGLMASADTRSRRLPQMLARVLSVSESVAVTCESRLAAAAESSDGSGKGSAGRSIFPLGLKEVRVEG